MADLNSNKSLVGKKAVVKQIKSQIGYPKRVRDTLQALGLGKISRKREVILNEPLIGMLKKTRHLLEIKVVE